MRHMHWLLTSCTMCVLFPGHLMMTMNLRSFKSLERSGIKWKNWSYQTWQHEVPFSGIPGPFSLEKKNKQEQSDQSDRRSLCIKIYIYGCKDRERKNDFGICLSKTLESPQNGLNQFLCVCVTVKPALFYIWCNNASVSIQKKKQMSLPPALRSTWEVKVKQRGGRSVW